MEKNIQRLILRNRELLIIAVVAFFLRLLFISPWLEDWDSVQFVLALNHYSVSEHLPHPPGYPLYILLGKLFTLIFSDGALALTIMSTVFGSLTVIPLFLLAKEMFDKKVALLSSLLFIVTPIHWTLSEVVLTNIPGQFFLVTLTYFLYKYRHSFKGVLLVSFLFGLMLGIRFTELPIIISLITLVLITKRDLKLVFLTIISFLCGLLIWIIPLIYITGPDKFLSSFSFIANYIFKHDSLGLANITALGVIRKRFLNYFNLLTFSYTIPLLLTFIIGFFMALKKGLISGFEIIFLLIFLLSYSLTHLLLYNMEATRYTLPLLPPLIILSSFFIFRVLNKYYVYILSLFLLSYLVVASVDQLSRFKSTTPATISPVLFVKKNFDPNSVTILSSVTFRQFQYYAPNYQVYSTQETSPKIDKEIVIIDYLGTIEMYPILKNYEIIQQLQFNVDRDIFSRVYQTNIYILRKND